MRILLIFPIFLLCLFILVLADPAVWPIDPQNSPHEIEHNFGDFEGSKGFHKGIDINDNHGTDVKACITGVIREVQFKIGKWGRAEN